MILARWMAMAAIAVMAAFGTAQAQQPQIMPAPAFHAGIKVTFPQQVGGAEQTKTVDYAKTFNRPELGQSWHYSIPGTISASVYVFTLGQTSIPNGAASPAVHDHFKQAMAEIQQSQKYEKIAVAKGPANCVFGTIAFRCVTENATVVQTKENDRLQLLVTGFRNHFVKVRLDWHQGSAVGDAAADRFMQGLVSQVLR